MTDRRKAILRSIMKMAWGSRRTDASRAFSDCLRAAWKFAKRMDKACKKLMKQANAQGGRIQFNDITKSPKRRALTGQRWARLKDFRGAYVTAAFGG